MSSTTPRDVRLREALESDHANIVEVVDDWWGRRMQAHVPRLWFQHFTTTSLVADSATGELAGFAIGFVSQDHPMEAYLHLVGVAPNRRRRGIGRALVQGVADAAAARGALRLATIAWPGDPVALRFLRAVGFVVQEEPGLQRLYGTPSYTDWNRQGDDQVVLTRPI